MFSQHLKDNETVIINGITVEKLSILNTLNEQGMKEKKYFYRRGFHDEIVWLKNQGLIKAVKITDTLYYKYAITEKGKELLALQMRGFKNRSK